MPVMVVNPAGKQSALRKAPCCPAEDTGLANKVWICGVAGARGREAPTGSHTSGVHLSYGKKRDIK